MTKRTPKLNVEELKLVKKQIANSPNYDQGQYCGTGACVAGQVYLNEMTEKGYKVIWPNQHNLINAEEEGADPAILLLSPKGELKPATDFKHDGAIHAVAQKRLGLDDRQADFLFRPHNCSGKDKGKEIDDLIKGKPVDELWEKYDHGW